MGAPVRGDIAKARHRELTRRVKEKNLRFREAHPTGLQVLLESGKEGVYQGFDQYFNRLLVESDEDLRHSWLLLDRVDVGKEGNRARYPL